MSNTEKFVPAPCPFCGLVADYVADHSEKCYFRLKAAFEDRKKHTSAINADDAPFVRAINAAWNTRPIEEKLIREIVALIVEKL